MQGSAFERETSVVADPEVPGRYTATSTERWRGPVVTFGGVMVSTALRAMTDALGLPDQRLRTATTVFAAQVGPGPIEVDVSVLRRGRTMSQLQATVRHPGAAAGHTTLAVFGEPRRGFGFTDIEPPEVPPPDACPSFRDEVPPDAPPAARDRAPVWDNIQSRLALGHAVWEDWDPVTSLRAYWYRYDEPPLRPDGTWDPLAVVALCDTMPGAVGERAGPSRLRWVGPSADLTVHILGEARSPWLLAVNRARHAGDGYASLEMEIWDPEGGLVAVASQVCFFTFLGEKTARREPGLG